MLTREQLIFVKESLTQKGAAVPCGNNGDTARLFIATLDELDAQLKALDAAPKPVN